MYTLKSILKRGSLLGAAGAMLVAAIVPAGAAFADALNPLTDRSLLLTSSAPGFQDSDGAGNSESNPNAYNGGEYYALPGSGPNGKKSGETFTFKVSTDSSAGATRPIKAFSLQYCTTAAGLCQAPGDNTGDARGATPTRESNATAHPLGRSDLELVYPPTAIAGTDFQVFVNNVDVSAGWTLTTDNKEDDAFAPSGSNLGNLTGKDNYMTLARADGSVIPAFNQEVRLVFKASTNRYITNPGSGSFFVKINTWDTDTLTDHVPGGAHNIDGGVTVANVMTDSIHITTKVLETMAFSVGTQNPDTLAVQHGSCDAVNSATGNRLNLGNANAENSLETTQAYDQYSYWRLSSNSSGGATVYYSGDTLRNTVGDEIKDMDTMAHSQIGTEQFGLALVNAGADTLDTGSFPANHITPNIAPLAIETDYASGAGAISNADPNTNAQFKFMQTSKAIPEVIAQNNNQVVSCATAKVRYVGNIAADTPAGVYTTKINYLAAPQY